MESDTRQNKLPKKVYVVKLYLRLLDTVTFRRVSMARAGKVVLQDVEQQLEKATTVYKAAQTALVRAQNNLVNAQDEYEKAVGEYKDHFAVVYNRTRVVPLNQR
jgi:hypothetical protein